MIRQMQRQKKGKDITENVELLDEKKKKTTRGMAQ